MATTPMIDAPTIPAMRPEYLVVPLKEAKNLKKEEDAIVPEHLGAFQVELTRRFLRLLTSARRCAWAHVVATGAASTPSRV